jgi:lipoprotein-anchoring transpeptidase ErfK/SrfK
MDARFVARTFPNTIVVARLAAGLSLAVAALAGLPGEALAQYSQQQPQYYPPAQGPYTPAPPPGYEESAPPPGYGRPSGAGNYPYDQSQRPQGGIQSEALPPPGGGQPGGPYRQDAGLPPPPGRGYTYGNWEPVRPPGGAPGAAYNPNEQTDYATRPPMEITPPQGVPPAGYPAAGSSPPPATYAGLPPEDQPETGRPKELPPQFRRQMVDFPTSEPAGTIIVDTPNTYLYLTLGGGKAMRYGIGVGREGFTWAGREKITRVAEWPDWHPPKEMIERQPYLPRFMAGGESNPLGARALYLGSTVYRIHGTNQPSTIGSFVSSGCIRLTNNDIEDLYSRVTVGTKVVVMPGGGGHRPASDTTASAH